MLYVCIAKRCIYMDIIYKQYIPNIYIAYMFMYTCLYMYIYIQKVYKILAKSNIQLTQFALSSTNFVRTKFVLEIFLGVLEYEFLSTEIRTRDFFGGCKLRQLDVLIIVIGIGCRVRISAD